MEASVDWGTLGPKALKYCNLHLLSISLVDLIVIVNRGSTGCTEGPLGAIRPPNPQAKPLRGYYLATSWTFNGGCTPIPPL